MRIWVHGAGSLGSVLGGVLAAAGHEVTLVSRTAAHRHAIQRHGLRLVDDDGERSVHVDTAAQPGDLTDADLVIVLVKSYDTQAAAEQLAGRLGDDTCVLTLQNGVGCEEMLGEVLGADRVLAGRTFVGGNLIAPGVVEYGTMGRRTTIGELDGQRTARLERIGSTFEAAGLATDLSDDITSMMWEKLFVNVATGAWSALTRLPYGELSVHPDVEAMAVATVAEAIAVAHAAGISVVTTDPAEPWQRAWRGLPFEFRASMLQSIERGQRTEVDVMHGAVCATGRRVGVPTPINDTLLAAVRGLERSIDRAGPRD